MSEKSHRPREERTFDVAGHPPRARDEIASRVVTLGLHDWVFQKVA
jgi:hypothetical protein